MGKKDKALVLAMAAAPDSDYGAAKKDVDVTYAANSTAATTHTVIRTEDSTVHTAATAAILTKRDRSEIIEAFCGSFAFHMATFSPSNWRFTPVAMPVVSRILLQLIKPDQHKTLLSLSN